MSLQITKAAGGLTLAALLLSTAACSTGGGGAPGVSLSMQDPGGRASVEQTTGQSDTGAGQGATGGDRTQVSMGGGGGGGGGDPAQPVNPPAPNCAGCNPYGPGGPGLIRETLDTATNLVTAGNADLTGGLLGQVRSGVLDPALGALQTTVNPVTQIAVADTALLGGATGAPLAGVSALSNGQVGGTLATVGLLNNGGGLIDASVGNTAGALGAVAPAAINLGGQTVVGGAGAGTTLVAVNGGGGNATGQVATVNVLNGGGGSPLAGVTGALANPTGLVDVNVGGTQLLGGGGTAAVAVGVGAPAAPASVAGVGVLSGGQGSVGGVINGVVGGATGTVNSVVGGLLGH